MVVLMGGRYSQGYTLFQQLTVKAFLAIRPYADQIVSTVELMLGTELPSFKGEPTIRRLRERFALGLNERQAAEWMMGVVKNAHENMRSIAYDEFQRVSVVVHVRSSTYRSFVTVAKRSVLVFLKSMAPHLPFSRHTLQVIFVS